MQIYAVIAPVDRLGLLVAAITDVTPKGIAAAVHRLIRVGVLGSGDRLPTVRELACALLRLPR